MRTLMPLALLFTLACKKEDPERPTGPTDEDTDLDTDVAPQVGNPVSGPVSPVTIDIDEVTAPFSITEVVDGQAYRVTLVHSDNLTVNPDGSGVFVDADNNGAADAGPSEEVARIWGVNYNNITPVKTYPAGTDDPNAPTGIFPIDDEIIVHVQGYGGGTVYPVVYVNGGASTFLEVDANGAPTEPYAIGAAITVNAPPPPPLGMAPLTPTTVAVGESSDYTIVGLDDTYAYRITLVVAENITTDGVGGATFVDADVNGAADAGASEAIAGIASYNATPVSPPVKTIPSPTDDPLAPTGVYPSGGEITVSVTGIAAGTIYPVAYRNGGASTFLEVDPVTLAPVEVYTVGGSFTVQ